MCSSDLVFGRNRIFFVGHGRGAFLALGKAFLGFQDFGALEMAQLRGHAFDSAGEQGQGGEKGGMAVALDDLGRDGVHGQTEPVQGDGLHLGVEVGIAAHGPEILPTRTPVRAAVKRSRCRVNSA